MAVLSPNNSVWTTEGKSDSDTVNNKWTYIFGQGSVPNPTGIAHDDPVLSCWLRKGFPLHAFSPSVAFSDLTFTTFCRSPLAAFGHSTHHTPIFTNPRENAKSYANASAKNYRLHNPSLYKSVRWVQRAKASRRVGQYGSLHNIVRLYGYMSWHTGIHWGIIIAPYRKQCRKRWKFQQATTIVCGFCHLCCVHI